MKVKYENVIHKHLCYWDNIVDMRQSKLIVVYRGKIRAFTGLLTGL